MTIVGEEEEGRNGHHIAVVHDVRNPADSSQSIAMGCAPGHDYLRSGSSFAFIFAENSF
jgi:hypothetical protein